MSVWYYLLGADGEVLTQLDGGLVAEGGTYAVGGWDTCELNVTYNYSQRYSEVWHRIFGDRDYPGMVDWLQGRIAQDTLEELTQIRDALTTSRSADYWEATEGNARHALDILISFAEQHPEGVWSASG